MKLRKKPVEVRFEFDVPDQTTTIDVVSYLNFILGRTNEISKRNKLFEYRHKAFKPKQVKIHSIRIKEPVI